MAIREATSEADIGFIARHFEDTIALWENYEVTKKSVTDREKLVSEWIAQAHTHFTVALAPDEGIVGFNSLWITEGNTKENCGKICILYVLPEYRGQGIARQLKLEGEKWLKSRGIRRVVTEIDAKNDRMLKISRQAGFRIKSLVMEKKL